MADAASDFVTVTITIDSVGPSEPGFGVLALLTHDAPWTDRQRYYSSTADAAADGFAATHPVYLALTRIFSQEIKPDLVAVVLVTPSVRQAYEIGVYAVKDSTAYTVNVVGQGVTAGAATYTSDASATNDEIVAGLVTALNAIVGRCYTAEATGTVGSKVATVISDEALVFADATFTADATANTLTIAAHGLQTGDGPLRATTTTTLPGGLALATDYWFVRVDANTVKACTSRENALATVPTVIDITDTGTGTHTLSDTASSRALADNVWYSLEVAKRTLLTNAQTHAAPTAIATDLDEAILEDDGWFGVYTLHNSPAYILAVSSWCEANARIYAADSCDSEAETALANVGTDGLAQLDAAGPANTMGVYAPSPASFLGAASFGRWLATDPGASVPFGKTMVGVTAVALSPTGRRNVLARHASYYVRALGIDVFAKGEVPSRTYRYIDVTRNLLWLSSRVQTEAYAGLVGPEIVRFDTAGIQSIGGKVRAVVEGEAVDAGVLAGGLQAPTVTLPEAEDVPTADKETRTLNDVKFAGTLTGAVFSVDVVGSVVF